MSGNGFNYRKFNIESHPYGSFINEDTKWLIIGTFPTHNKNSTFNFFYSGKSNNMWNILSKSLKMKLEKDDNSDVVNERKAFLKQARIGITDMHEICYRYEDFSTDESLRIIKLNDIFAILDRCLKIETLIMTSRTPVIGALGLLKIYFMQQNKPFPAIYRRDDNILEGTFFYNGRSIKILVPYSPSPRLTSDNNTTMDELVAMYAYCFS